MSEVDVVVFSADIVIIFLFFSLTLWSFDRYPFDTKHLGKYFLTLPPIFRSFVKIAGPIVIIYKLYGLINFN